MSTRQIFKSIIIVSGLVCIYSVNSFPGLINDTLSFEYKEESMSLLVQGNSDSKNILIFLHGGPGGSALELDNSTNFSEKNVKS